MKIKERMSKFIATKLTDEQKREMIQKLYDRHKLRPDVDKLVDELKKRLSYDKDDVPRRD